MFNFPRILLSLLVLVLMVSSAMAELSLNRHYSDHMVLQREKPVLIRGLAEEGATVTVSFSGQTKEGVANEKGEWAVTLDPMKANKLGGDLTASSKGKNIKLRDVLVGDVFLFAKQTSVDIRLGKDEAGQSSASDLDGVRVIVIKTQPTYDPQLDLVKGATEGWSKLDKAAAMEMTASTFHTAKGLSQSAEVPLGIIDINLGYHFPIAWMSKEALLQTRDIFGENVSQVDSMFKLMEEFRSRGEDHHKNKNRGFSRGEAHSDARHPAAGYNAVLHPMRGLSLKALLLQLGNDYPYYLYQRIKEDGKITNHDYLGQAFEDTYDIRKWCGYLKPYTVPRLPREWRKTFGDMDLPVGLITPPASDLATMAIHHYEIREVQRKTAEKEKGVGLILPGVEHIPFSAQPADAGLLGQRSLTWIKGAVYKEDGVIPTGPLFERAEVSGNEARVFFKTSTIRGLKVAPGSLDHFEVAGLDHIYSPAKAELDGDSILLRSDTVEKISYVRYNWKQKPNQGLTNASGLPAVGFKTDEKVFTKRIFHPADPTPVEFTTPISEWKMDGPVIYNGKLNSGTDGGAFLGPTGIRVSAFGPNLFVNNVYIGSPADGKIMHGDYLFGVNGENFVTTGLQNVQLQIAEAITHAETEAGKGLISFEVYRESKKFTVELTLEVLGSYSMTSPYNCEKTDRIVANAEAYVAKWGGVTGGWDARRNRPSSQHPAFTTADSLFLLGAGSPEYQGLVRRNIYNLLAKYEANIANPKRDGSIGGGAWDLSAELLLMSEYYLATGDKAVLPYMAKACDKLSSRQVREPKPGDTFESPAPGASGGWRHNFPGGYYYGTMPAIGVPATLGYHLTKEAGVQYDFSGYDRAVNWFLHNGALVGSMGYGFSPTKVTRGNNVDPERLLAGKMGAGNGAMGGAAILFDLIGNGPVARTNSFSATHAWNNTWYAHGGHFWLNMYTAIGSKVHGKKSFMYFMKGNRGYQELHRMHNHSRQQDRAVGVGHFISHVAPRERLRILGAHESVFAPNPPEVLKPALESYHSRDYAESEKVVSALLAKGELNGLELKQAQQLQKAAKLIQKSIELDLAKVKKLLSENKTYEASLDLVQLQAVVKEDHSELKEIAENLSSEESKAAMKADQERYNAFLATLALKMPAAKKEEEEDLSSWVNLVLGEPVKVPRGMSKDDPSLPKQNLWRMNVLESIEKAPEGWMKPEFDDSSWRKTTLPISWRDNHTSLMRTTFVVDDPSSIKELKLNQYAFQNRSIQIYLNGKLVSKITDSGGGSRITVPLNAHALSLLKEGENTFAATYKHHWRWGRYFKGKSSVYGKGINLSLVALKK